MTLPLKKERDHDEAVTNMASGPTATQASEELARGREQLEPGGEQIEQGRPQLVRSDLAKSASEGTLKPGPDGDAVPLLMEKDRQELQGRWNQIQTAFVDEPRNAVHDADALVSSAIDRLSKGFADERSKLEQQWDKGDSVSTEDLRVALQRYRAFFQRMLSV